MNPKEPIEDEFNNQEEDNLTGFSVLWDEGKPPEDEFKNQEKDRLSTGLSILSFLVPLAGAIIYYSKKPYEPRSAKTACNLAWWGFGIGMAINILANLLTAKY
ncbi:MAG: hypothetical protein LBU83_03615 [Bacteroidales bacterium]|jgi:hypothetical protein|nr:hypothetical protein [Bacteroidales bacterium]